MQMCHQHASQLLSVYLVRHVDNFNNDVARSHMIMTGAGFTFKRNLPHFFTRVT